MMKSVILAATMLAVSMATAEDADASHFKEYPVSVKGANVVKSLCRMRQDQSHLQMRAMGLSWEADGSGDAIEPHQIAKKVKAKTVTVAGKVKLTNAEDGAVHDTLFAYIGKDCSNTDKDTDVGQNFKVDFGADGMAEFHYHHRHSYVSSDLQSHHMALNLRDAAGESQICCHFIQPDAAYHNRRNLDGYIDGRKTLKANPDSP